jgi:diacylglycerol kinase family enzyme
VRIALLHNQAAGDGDMSSKKLVRMVGKVGDVVYRSTKKKHWKRVFEQPFDLIVAAGGDGTVRQVALHAPLRSRVAILPLGTANNVANSLGIRGELEKLIAGWKKADVLDLDLGRALGPWGDARFLEGLGIGAITHTAARMESGEAEGDDEEPEILRARKTLSAILSNGRAHWFEVTVDGQAICDKTVLLEIANMRYIGPRLAMASGAHPDDGLLDIIWVPDGERQALRDWLERASVEERDAPVRSCQGSSVQIHHGMGQVRLDDQFWPSTPNPESDADVPDIDITVDRGALSVLVPKKE